MPILTGPSEIALRSIAELVQSTVKYGPSSSIELPFRKPSSCIHFSTSTITAPSRTPCLVAQEITLLSEINISGLWHAFANASSAVTQSPCTSLPHMEYFL